MSETQAASPNGQPIDEPSSLAPPPQPRVRIVRYDQYFDQRTFSVTLRKTSKSVGHRKVNKKKPVLTVRRIIDSRGQHEKTEVDIRSEALCTVLLEINQDVYNLELTKSEPVADPHLLFHSRSGLLKRLAEEEKKPHPDASFIFDITAALHFIEEDLGSTISNFNHLTSLNKITHELLWALFSPNTLVYRHHPFVEQHQVLACRSLVYDRDQSGFYAELMCDIITNDGNAFGRAREHLRIPSFKGTYKIQDLPVYPLDCHTDKTAVYEHAVQRGKRFTGITRRLFNATGFAVGEKTNMLGQSSLTKFNTFGRVMIDAAAFRLFEPNNSVNNLVYSVIEEDREHLSDEQYLICTPIVLGFSFATKMWGGFAVEGLIDVVWSDDAFRLLVLNEKQKQLIRALIRQHAASAKSNQGSAAALFDDIVVGKGKGLVGLLCGNPGCGKTLTAEAAAEITHSPLYVVSAGELGTTPEDVDVRLARILELASMWNAVLLLDEAEVFLHRRSSTDLARNALVSIFLRQLEYYKGILILTTNMVAQCDPAFESRIHFCIKYPDLDFESRKKVWKTFIGKAAVNPNDISERDIDRLTAHKMNGRQIKNAVSIAQCIALDQGSPLLVDHIDTVLETLNDWETARDTALCSMG